MPTTKKRTFEASYTINVDGIPTKIKSRIKAFSSCEVLNYVLKATSEDGVHPSVHRVSIKPLN